MEQEMVTEFLNWLKTTYANDGVGKVKTSRGNVHEYLGMKIDYSSQGEVKFNMSDYVKEMIEEFGKDINMGKGNSNTPAAEHLFEIRDTADKLNQELASKYHTFTAKGLFLCKRARPDIQPIVSVLCTRVKKPGT